MTKKTNNNIINSKTDNENKKVSVLNIDLSTGVTEGNPDDDIKIKSKEIKINNNINKVDDKSSKENLSKSLSQLSLIFVTFCEALASSSTFSSFTSETPTIRWLIYASFYIAQLLSSLPVICIPPSLLSRRTAILLSLTGIAIGQIAYGFSNSLPLWVATRAIAGFFAGGTAYARTALASATPSQDMPKLFICASLAYNTGIAIGSSLCLNFQRIFTGDEDAEVPPLHPFFLDFPQAPIGLASAFFVIVVIVFALFFMKSQDCSEKRESKENGKLPKRFLVMGCFIFFAVILACVYSGSLSSMWFVSENGLMFNRNGAVLLCIHFVITAMIVHLILVYICTNNSR